MNPLPFRQRSFLTTTRLTFLTVLLLVLAACGGDAAVGTPASRPAGTGDGIAQSGRVIALPVAATATLNALNDRGQAFGFQADSSSDGIHLPLRVSEAGAVIASEANFFGSDAPDWTLLRTAGANTSGVMAGHGIVGGTHVGWLWDAARATRLQVPAGQIISAVVGPADIGSIAAVTFDASTEMQQVLLWQPGGSRALIYQTVPVKAGMSLFGMAGNGWIGGLERDGILLTPTLYDGSWRKLPINVIDCRCEPVRINSRGQVLMTPRRDLGGDPRGYLVNFSGTTLLPRPDASARYVGLNDLGDVVGLADSGPFVIMDGLLHDLNAYVDSARLGWRLRTAVAINNQRQVLGLGDWQGQARWYRLNLR